MNAPQPARGIMFRRCCVCGADLGSVAVDAADPCNGAVSHGYCPACQAAAQHEAEEYLRHLSDEPEATRPPDALSAALWDIARWSAEQFAPIPWVPLLLLVPAALLWCGVA